MKLLIIIFLTFYSLIFVTTTYAVVDPLSVANNRFGVHLTSPDSTKIADAQGMLNSNGDWGYVTMVIQDNDLDKNKWQSIFDNLRRSHLIPIMRLATHGEGNYWVHPSPDEEKTWATFLNNLYWPIKNRYIIVYNEPNNALEWGNTVNASDYAQILDKTISALKNTNQDFFILNAGLDEQAPQKLPAYQDMVDFMIQMNKTVPGIFNKLDGWVSHSYPNPNYSGSPKDTGRATVRSFEFDKQVLKQLGLTKNLPIFITETGWKHAEGITYDNNLLKADKVAQYYTEAYSTAWNNPSIVAVTPFLIEAIEIGFDHFSFKRPSPNAVPSNGKPWQVLGIEYPDFYPQYQAIHDFIKPIGKPIQENKAEVVTSGLPASISVLTEYHIPVTVKNTGQSIWGENGQVSVAPSKQLPSVTVKVAALPNDTKVEPGKTVTFDLIIKASQLGSLNIPLQLYIADKPFDSAGFDLNTDVKTTVAVTLKASLLWKSKNTGDFILIVDDSNNASISSLQFDNQKQESHISAASLFPDKKYTFTLSRPYYQSKVITTTLKAGMNIIDFGTLSPNFIEALPHPRTFLSLLPF